MSNPRQFLAEAVEDSLRLKNEFFRLNTESVVFFYEMLQKARIDRKKLLIFGNGGSAADAQHFSAEVMHRVETSPIGIRSIALHTDASLVTALSNDEGFATVYARQIEMLADEEDVAIAISTSGRSINILEALKSARKLKCRTVGLLGRDGGQAAKLCDIPLIVPHQSTPRIQEVHGMIIHLVCQMLERF